MKKNLVFTIVALGPAACIKDKFQTTPQLTIKSTSSKLVNDGEALRVTFQYTDKEGDVADTLYMKKIRLNRHTVSLTLRDSVAFQIPDFPNHDIGDIQFALGSPDYLISAATPPRIPGSNPPAFEPDTLDFKFVLKDKAGHKSDTVTLSNVIVLR